MLVHATIANGVLSIVNPVRYKELLSTMRDDEYTVEIKRLQKTRSEQANRALHLYLTQFAEAAEQAGLTVGIFYDNARVPWSPSVAKELWRTVQKQMVDKKSTRQLTSQDIDRIYDVMNLIMTEAGGPHIPFPSIEQLYYGNS
jgi:hypothetical protein